MSNSIFHVRPLDSGKGWQSMNTTDAALGSTACRSAGWSSMDKIQAQRAVFQLRRKAVNSAKPKPPVNKHAELLPASASTSRRCVDERLHRRHHQARVTNSEAYYEHAGITIYHGDCRDVLRR